MQIDPQADRAMKAVLDRPLRSFRRPWLQLLSAVINLAGTSAELLRHGERPWASVTFSGTRHTIALAFTGQDGVTAGERFITALPDYEFSIPRQLVADATIVSVEQTTIPNPRLVIECELLLLEDA